MSSTPSYIFSIKPMKNPLILIEDPLDSEYDDFVTTCLQSIDDHIDEISLVFLKPVADVNQLNQLLSHYYYCIRSCLTQLGYNYKTATNVLFNLQEYQKLLEKIDGICVEESEHVPFEHDKPTFQAAGRSTERSKGQKVAGLRSQMPEDVTAVGGTFDHLHDGHKILLSVAIYLTKKRLIIGVTGSKLLKNKKYAEVLEPFELRKKSVQDFVGLLLKGGIRYDLYEINDVCGPTGYVKDINCLVVSGESAKGAEFVNNYRFEREYPPLSVFVIDVVGGKNSKESNNWEGKLSSTQIRKELATTS